MLRFLSLIRRFRKDERGAFAVIFAVMAIVLIAMSGAVVDFTALQQSRTRAQVALDAAALALQPSIYTGTVTVAQTTIQGQAQALLVDRLADKVTSWGNCHTNSNKPPCAYVSTPVIDTTAGQLTLSATVNVPTSFVSLVGVTSVPAQIISVATRKKLNLEVALVLDNSGSMSTSFGTGTRLSTLKASANCASNILFYGVTTCSASTTGLTPLTNVKMAVVPFNDEVNVGTGNASATWLDRAGNDSTTFDDDNFDSDDNSSTVFSGTVDRIALFGQIKKPDGVTALSWGGCVEARKSPYDTDDTLPTSGATLFTPFFAPDNPDTTTTSTSHGHTTTTANYDNSYIDDAPAACNRTGTCTIVASTPNYTYNAVTTITTTNYTVTTTKTTTSRGHTTTTTISGPTSFTTTSTTGPTTSGGSGSSTTTVTLAATNGQSETGSSVCSCSGSGTTTQTTPVTNGSLSKSTSAGTVPGDVVVNNSDGSKTTTHYTSVSVETDTQPMKMSLTNTNSCSYSYDPTVWPGLTEVELQERLCKYTGAVMTSNPSTSSAFGPNSDCPVSAIQPLTATPGTLTTAVNSMVADGNTNIQEGAAWGWRVLSPTAPFTEGLAYDSATSKVMIIMTDGENTFNTDDDSTDINGSYLYSPYGYPRDNTINGSTDRGRMGSTSWSDSDYETQINSRLSTTCTNAKNAGITIYTIGLATNATSNPTGNTTLLTNCASAAGDAYFPNTAADLQAAFVAIAGQLAALRLAR